MESVGKRSLVDYGIGDDKSDYRAHVGFGGDVVYLFETQKAREALIRGKEVDRYEYKRGRVPGASQDTFAGYPVPWMDIEGCLEIDIPGDILEKHKPREKDTTYVKGDAAEAVIKEMLFGGFLPMSLDGIEVDDKSLQIDGLDFAVSVSLQVKCDWRAGRGGWGNLFLQTAEIHERGIQGRSLVAEGF